MYEALFVAVCLFLLLLAVLAHYGMESTAIVRRQALEASVPRRDNPDVWNEYLFFERLVQSGLVRLTTRLAVALTFVGFCMLVCWLAWVSVYKLNADWQGAYVVLAFIGLFMLTPETEHPLPARRIMVLVVALCGVWVLLHLFGITHITIPSFRVPRIEFTIP